MSIGCIGIGDWKPGDCIPGLAITRSGALHLGKGVSSANISRSQPDGDAGTLGTFRPLRDRYHASTPSFRAYEVFELTRSAPGSIRTQGGQRVILLWVGTSAVIPASPRLIGCCWWRKAVCAAAPPLTPSHPRHTPRSSVRHLARLENILEALLRTPEAASGSTRSHRASLHTAPRLLPPPLISD